MKGPEPHVFRSVRAESDPEPEDDAAAATDEPVSDSSILERFEALKRTLGDEEGLPSPEPGAASPAPSPPAPATPDPVESAGSLDELQARVQEVRHEERARGATDRPASDDQPPATGPSDLTYEQLERIKQAEAVTRRRAAKKEKRRQRRQNRSFWRELPILVVVALVVAVIIKTFFFQAFYIPSGSMIPELEINDRVLVNKLSYRFGAIERGDILVFDSPEAIDIDRSFLERVFRSVGEATGLTSPDTVLIKRVIGLPGETVEVRDNQVYVNGNPIAEPYLPEGVSMRDEPEITVPANQVFMMGDNRNASNDSRRFGPIPRNDIVGRAFVTVWPPGAWSGL
ncbi:MAG: signal peptidase I [Acidimicrobiia bacterium]|nr:signal peptidase I [Acidimicrobiia bacterium]